MSIKQKITSCSKVKTVFSILFEVVFFFLAGAGFSQGVEYTWEPLRIGGGGWVTGIDIAADGTKVVRTDTYGAYVWSDLDLQWKQLVTVASMPSEDHRVDYGVGVYEIRIAPSNPNRFYMMYMGEVYRSEDKGGPWTKTSFVRVSADPNDGYRMHGRKMAIDPVNPDVVYAGTTNDGLWVTADEGASWAQVAAVPNGAADEGGMTGIAFDPSSGQTDGKTNTIYVCSWGNGVYRSDDAGDSWALTTGGPATVHHGIVSNGVYYAVDGATAWKYEGSSWNDMNPPERDWHTVAIDPADSQRVVLGGSGGYLCQSLDGGNTWGDIIWGPEGSATRVADDIPWLAWTTETYMSSGDMVFDPIETNKLWFVEGIGVWFATDFTRDDMEWNDVITWNSQNRGIENLCACQILVPPDGKPVVISMDRPIFYVDNPDTYPTQHGPDRDYPTNSGWDGDYAIDDPEYIAALINWSGRERSGYSTDGGQTWQPFATLPDDYKLGGCMAVSTAGNIVWIPENNGVPYYTKDNGATWTQCDFPGAPTSGETGWGFLFWLDRNIIAADWVTPGRFYAFNYITGLYSSSDSGDTWTLIKPGSMQMGDGWNAKLRTVPGQEGHLFFTVGHQGGGLGDTNPADYANLMWSTDGGFNWTTLSNVKEVYDIGFGQPAVAGGYPAVFISGWVDDVWGVWRSTDSCVTWEKIGDFPLGSLDMVKVVAGDPNIYGRVYVGFSGSGYAYGDPASGGSEEGEPNVPQKIILYQNYPNPFSSATTIRYQLSAISTIKLSVYDILGREALTLVEGTRDPGYYSATLDGSKLTSGIYFVRFVANPKNGGKQFIQIKKAVLTK